METGFVNRIIGLILALVVGGLLVGGLLIPTVEGIQDTIGDPITKTNTTAVLLRPAEDGDVLNATWDGAKWIWTLNDEEITGIDENPINWNSFVISDCAYMSSRGATDWASSLTVFDTNPLLGDSGFGNSNYENYITVTFTADTITFTGPMASPLTSPQVATYSWAYVICPEKEATYTAAVAGGSAYVKNTNDLILCGVYTTGDNDCSYIYKNGQATVFGAEYDITVNQTLTLTNGTTDIYTDAVSVDIGDENFTPFRIFVPYEITGHATAGTYYVMFGVISILGIVALVIVAANGIRNKY